MKPQSDSPHTLDMFSPENAAPEFGPKIRRIELDNITYFSILDLFEHYGSKGSAVNPAIYWDRVEKRLRKQAGLVAGEVITDLLFFTFEGTKRPTPIGTRKFCLRLSQVSEIKEWEKIRDWMAQVAVERIEETVNPELGIERAQTRFLKSKLEQGMTEDEGVEYDLVIRVRR